MTNPVHSYDNDFPADALPRGRFEGEWSGHYIVLDGSQAHVPTDVPVFGRVRVVLHVTDQTVAVEVVGLRSTLVRGQSTVHRRCRCGETAHDADAVLVGGRPAGYRYLCRNCRTPYAMWRIPVADAADPS